MDLRYHELENGARLFKLKGELDMHGMVAVEKHFAAVGAQKKATLFVDLSEVKYIASIGIRLLLTTAKALVGGGGRMAMLSPQPLVEEVLILSGITILIPIFSDLETATAQWAGPA